MSKKQEHSETYRNTVREYTQELKRIAYELDEAQMFPKAAERLLEMSREITSHTLIENVPDAGLLSDLKNLMDALGLKFVLIGGLAVNIHGQPRGTDDIDVIVNAIPDQTKTRDPRFMETFGFYRASSSTGTMMTIDHRKFGQVELLVANDPVRMRAIETAVETPVMRTPVPLVTPEALIALKAVAMSSPSRHQRKRDQDVADIVSIGLRNKINRDELTSMVGDERADEVMKIIDTARGAQGSQPSEEQEDF